MNHDSRDVVAFPFDLKDLEPPFAPLDMPRQVLEHAERPSIMNLVSRLFLRNA
ncbi:hypothetical protein [Loktanella salsilacus]|uniref:hypothetical protein n=1 Tax=Loktanella salsilacus TaxID=195913 RepID=UPI00373543F9